MQTESTLGVNKFQRTENTNGLKVSEKEVTNYVLERFYDTKNTNSIKNLVSFQSMNKFMIMAHDQEELKYLGNIVAGYKKNTLSDILVEYEKHLKLALKRAPTTKSHANVVMHIFGYFSKNFSQLEKEQFFKLFNQFRNDEIAIGKILSEINPIIYRFNNTYLSSQTYFLLYSDAQPGNLFDMLSK